MEQWIDNLTNIWGRSLFHKILLIIAAPVLLILVGLALFSKMGGFGKSEQEKRQDVDQKSSDLDKKITQDKIDTAVEEGKAQQLEQEKKDVPNQVKNQNPVDFYNDRYSDKPRKPDGSS